MGKIVLNFDQRSNCTFSTKSRVSPSLYNCTLRACTYCVKRAKVGLVLMSAGAGAYVVTLVSSTRTLVFSPFTFAFSANFYVIRGFVLVRNSYLVLSSFLAERTL